MPDMIFYSSTQMSIKFAPRSRRCGLSSQNAAAALAAPQVSPRRADHLAGQRTQLGNAVCVSAPCPLLRSLCPDHQDSAAENISLFEALMNRQCRLGVEGTFLRDEGPDVSSRCQLDGLVHLLSCAVAAAHDLKFLGKQITP